MALTTRQIIALSLAFIVIIVIMVAVILSSEPMPKVTPTLPTPVTATPAVIEPTPVAEPVPVASAPDTSNWCHSGFYCNREPVPQSAAYVGAPPVCGEGSVQYTCVMRNGQPSWNTTNTPCAADMYGKC